MRHIRYTLFALILAATVPAAAQQDTITILHLNDTHSVLDAIGPRDAALVGTLGGVARAASVIGMTRMQDPDALLLHAGDISIGDLFYTQYFAVAELQFLLALGVDAMTLGNHEFDLGPLALEQMVDTAFAAGGFPLLSANAIMDDPTVQGLKARLSPWVIKTIGTTKVGIFGLTTPMTNILSQPAPVVFDTNFVMTASAMVDSLTANGCTAVICLSHLGSGYDRILAGAVPGIHMIIGGHDHYRFEDPVPIANPLGDTTWIVQAESFYKAIGRARLVAAGSTVRLLDYILIPLDQSVPEEPTAKGIVATLTAGIEATYGPLCTQAVGTVTSYFDEVADSLDRPGWKDTPIGNLVADTYRSAFSTQIGIQAGGSTAHPLYPGPIVAADLFRVVGYGYNVDNGLGYHMATFTMSGAALFAGLEFGVSDIESGDEFLLQVSGLTYSYDPSQPPLNRITGATVGGQPVYPAAEYTIAANAFVTMFLDAIGIPYSNLHIFSGDTTEFQTLLSAVAAGGPLTPYRDGRIRAEITPVGIVQPTHVPASFSLAQNFPNPFNPETTIQYGIGSGVWDRESGGLESGSGSSGSVPVRLAVYDVLGREVALLVSGSQPPGEYQVRFNAAGFSSGVYLYRLEAGDLVLSRSMMLLK